MRNSLSHVIDSCNFLEINRRWSWKICALLVLPDSYSNGRYSLKPFVKTNSIFVHIPKAAGTSLATALFNSFVGGHRSISEYSHYFDDDCFSKMYKFSFVRNPYDRLYSAFNFLVKGGWHHGDVRFGNSLVERYGTFEHFVKDGLEDPSVHNYIHFQPQSDFLLMEGESTPSIDFIGRFENINEDFNRVKSVVNPDAELKVLNSSSEGRAGYRSAYTAEMIDIVSKFYARDLDMFSYDFEPNSYP